MFLRGNTFISLKVLIYVNMRGSLCVYLYMCSLQARLVCTRRWWVRVCVCVCMHTYGVRGLYWHLPQSLSTLFFKTRPLTDPRAHKYLGSGLQESSSTHLPRIELLGVKAPFLAFSLGADKMDTGPQSNVTVILPAMSSFQPQNIIFFWIFLFLRWIFCLVLPLFLSLSHSVSLSPYVPFPPPSYLGGFPGVTSGPSLLL